MNKFLRSDRPDSLRKVGEICHQDHRINCLLGNYQRSDQAGDRRDQEKWVQYSG